MRVLALDTTTREGSAALIVDDGVVDERRGEVSRSHAERLPGELVAIADAHGLALSDVDVFAVASGPGSFTGLRIGIATVQGLAFATGRPMIAVSALEALAQIGSAGLAPGALVAAWIDAHRGEVFSALYRVEAMPVYEPGRLTVVDDAAVGGPEATLARWADCLGSAPATFTGDGAVLYGETIERSRARHHQVLPLPLLAGAIGRIGTVRAQRGETIDPAAAQPLYVRRPDAELERDRKRSSL
jgi:tRNA threonylcarbamoyladenosine biosynthesis protein TsaB